MDHSGFTFPNPCTSWLFFLPVLHTILSLSSLFTEDNIWSFSLTYLFPSIHTTLMIPPSRKKKKVGGVGVRENWSVLLDLSTNIYKWGVVCVCVQTITEELSDVVQGAHPSLTTICSPFPHALKLPQLLLHQMSEGVSLPVVLAYSCGLVVHELASPLSELIENIWLYISDNKFQNVVITAEKCLIEELFYESKKIFYLSKAHVLLTFNDCSLVQILNVWPVGILHSSYSQPVWFCKPTFIHSFFPCPISAVQCRMQWVYLTTVR